MKRTAHSIGSLEDGDLITGLAAHPPDLVSTAAKGYLEQLLLPSAPCLSVKKKLLAVPQNRKQERASSRARHGKDVGIIRAGI